MASRFESAEDYRRYQERVAREAVLPVIRLLGVTLEGKRLLDVGCGTGGMTRVWREMGARTVGMDIDAGRLDGAGEGYIVGDVTAMPFDDGEFELVFAHDVLEHVRRFDTALAEMARVLAAGGLAVVAFPPFFGPYGGHQQGSRSIAKFLPYGHLLPESLWLSIAARAAYREMFAGLARLTMGAFETAAGKTPFTIERRLAYLVRPEVALRLGVPALGCPSGGGVAVLREVVTTGAYYLLRRR